MAKHRFEKLINDLDNLFQQANWISVEDGLPKKHKDFEDESIITAVNGWLITDGEKIKTTKLVPEFWINLAFKVTHYQPLPKPPKE